MIGCSVRQSLCMSCNGGTLVTAHYVVHDVVAVQMIKKRGNAIIVWLRTRFAMTTGHTIAHFNGELVGLNPNTTRRVHRDRWAVL